MTTHIYRHHIDSTNRPSDFVIYFQKRYKKIVSLELIHARLLTTFSPNYLVMRINNLNDRRVSGNTSALNDAFCVLTKTVDNIYECNGNNDPKYAFEFTPRNIRKLEISLLRPNGAPLNLDNVDNILVFKLTTEDPCTCADYPCSCPCPEVPREVPRTCPEVPRAVPREVLPEDQRRVVLCCPNVRCIRCTHCTHCSCNCTCRPAHGTSGHRYTRTVKFERITNTYDC